VQGCQKDSVESIKNSNSLSVNPLVPPAGFNTIQDYRNDIREKYAEALAKSLKEMDVRTFIKSKIANKVTSESEFLHAQFFNEMVNDSLSFAQILKKNSNETDSFFTVIVPYYDPRLTVLIPEDYEPENWDVQSLLPKVVAPPTEWDDTNSISLLTFDTSGSINPINSNNQPSTLTIVVGETELLIPFIKPYTGLNGPPIFSNEWYEYVPIENIVSNAGQSEFIRPQSDKSIISRSCSRDNSTKVDKMYSCKINGNNALNRIENWVRGNAELYFVATYNESLNQPALKTTIEKVLPQITRKEAKNQSWKNFDVDVMRWSSSSLMDNMKYAWMEEDGGAASTMPISLTGTFGGTTLTLSTSFNIRNRDDKAGESIVYYCDQVNFGGTDYNTGIVSFNIRQN